MNDDDAARLYAGMKELGVKIDHLTELFRDASHGDGFTRCAAQANRLDHVEDSVALCHARVSGVKKWLVAGLASLVGVLANFVWNAIRTSGREF